MTVKELRKLVEHFEKEGYEDSDIVILQGGWYEKISIELNSNEYGDVVVSRRTK